jgi:hypothetical protein
MEHPNYTIWQFPQPASSKHCSRCQACIARADYHCIWVGSCIGWGNYKHLLALLLSTTVIVILHTRTTGERSLYKISPYASICKQITSQHSNRRRKLLGGSSTAVDRKPAEHPLNSPHYRWIYAQRDWVARPARFPIAGWTIAVPPIPNLDGNDNLRT